MRTIILVHLVLGALALLVILITGLRRRRRDRELTEEHKFQDLGEAPPTLHPDIDPSRCIGSGGCVKACPEHRALVVFNGRARLSNAAGCVGHGACRDACPVEAISLVFGTAKRGVELPELDEHFQTSQPGLFIAGELGGMGLIATAVRQGVKAVEAIAETLRTDPGPKDVLPLLIIGAGPAGIAATLTARQLGLEARTIEKEKSIGGSIRAYPRGKIVMNVPAELPLYGRVHMRRTSKLALIELFEAVFQRVAIGVDYNINVDSVARQEDGVLVAQTSAGPIAAQRILLATGRRGRPRRLGVPGEDLEHVHYELEEPEPYDGMTCLVIGGGDTAVEAALALHGRPRSRVVLVHRGTTFDRIKLDNQMRLAHAEKRGLRVVRSAKIASFEPRAATIVTQSGGEVTVKADAAFVLVGMDLPTGLLASSGISVRTYHGEAVA